VDWIGLSQDRNRWRALVNSVLNLRIPWNAGKLSSRLTSSSLYIGWVHPVAHVTMNEYNNPSFATMFQRALLNTCIATCFDLNPNHHQVLSYWFIQYAKLTLIIFILGETLLRTKDCSTHSSSRLSSSAQLHTVS
jgi:hypothetical protein